MAGTTERIQQNSAGNLLRVLLDLLPDVVYVKDRRSVYILANAALARQFGVADATEVLGRTDHDFWPRPMADRVRQIEEHLMSEGEAGLEMEEHLIDRTGVERWYLSSKVSLHSSDGRVVGLVGISRDITDRKRVEVALRDANQALEERVRARTAELERTMQALARSEALYRDVVTHVDEYIYAATISSEGTPLESYHSPVCERITGWASHVFVEDETLWYRLIHPDDRAKVLARLDALRNDLAPMQVEHRLMHRDGSLRWVRNHCVARRTSDGALVLAGFVLDITTDRRLREELVSARESAEAANRAKSDFLASVSHEIRTPMNGILGMAEMLLRAPLPGELREWVGTIHSSGQALLGIIEELLDFARIESGAPSILPAPADLRTIAEEAVELLALRAEGKGLQLSLRWRAPAMQVADALRFRQILLNLIGNAVKFTATGSVDVEVDSATTDPAGAMPGLRVSVRDTGPGLSRDQIDRLFQPYQQADQVMGRMIGGSGLGLAISKRLVELMGGRIGVSSELGVGSCFWCELPLAPVESVPAEQAPARPGSDALAPAGVNGRRYSGPCPPRQRVLVIARAGRVGEILVEQLADLDQQAMLVAVDAASAVLAEAAAQRQPWTVAVGELPPPVGDWPAPAWIRVVAISQVVSSPLHDGDAPVATLARPVRIGRLAAALGGRQPGESTPPASASARLAVTTHTLAVLVVDDDPGNQRVASIMLRELGCQVHVAGDGASAVALLDAHAFDLVLLDQNLPDAEGTDIAKRIRERETERPTTGRPRAAIIGCTAGRVETMRQHCLDSGMDEVLAKPVSLAALAAVVRRQLPGRSSEADLIRVKHPLPSRDVMDQAVIDRHLALKGGPELVRQLVVFWRTDAATLFPLIREAARAGDQRRLAQTAHRLLGSARTLGLLRVIHHLSQIEEAARAGAPPPNEAIEVHLVRVMQEGVDAANELLGRLG